MKMPFGTPGGDVQTQAMLQVFLNIHLFGMEVQEAVEAPRVASYSYPVLVRAARLSSRACSTWRAASTRPTGEALGRLGHKIEWWPDWTWLAGAVCTDRRRPGDRRAQGRRRPAPAVLCARAVTACARNCSRLAGWRLRSSCSAAARRRPQTYPTRPIRLISPFAAGGANDVLARVLAAKLADRLGGSVVVENRPGAGAVIGITVLARSTPDGYTLVL